MDASTVLRYQLETGQRAFAELVGSMTPGEWLAGDPGSKAGFLAWHMPATVDWAVQSWLRDVPPVRSGPSMAARRGINPPYPAFGMTTEEADTIAQAASRDDVLAYAEAAWGSALAWLDGASDADLERATEPYNRLVAGHDRWPGYIEEVDTLRSRACWQILVGPCIGHIRGHLGELDAALEALRRR